MSPAALAITPLLGAPSVLAAGNAQQRRLVSGQADVEDLLGENLGRLVDILLGTIQAEVLVEELVQLAAMAAHGS